MVTVVDYVVNTNDEGKEFVSLVLESDLEIIQSQKTGKYYATTRKCQFTSSLSEIAAKRCIGKEMPGQIIKQSCAPYSYTIQETGEVVELDYTWVFVPDEKPEPVHQQKPFIQPVKSFRQSLIENGAMAPM